MPCAGEARSRCTMASALGGGAPYFRSSSSPASGGIGSIRAISSAEKCASNVRFVVKWPRRAASTSLPPSSDQIVLWRVGHIASVPDDYRVPPDCRLGKPTTSASRPARPRSRAVWSGLVGSALSWLNGPSMARLGCASPPMPAGGRQQAGTRIARWIQASSSGRCQASSASINRGSSRRLLMSPVSQASNHSGKVRRSLWRSP